MKQSFNQLFDYFSFSWANQYIDYNKEYIKVSNVNSETFETNLCLPFSVNFDLRDQVSEPQKNLLFNYNFVFNENETNLKFHKQLVRVFWRQFVLCLILKCFMVFLTTCLNFTLKNFMKVVNPTSKLSQCLLLIGLQTIKILLDTQINFQIAKMSLDMQTFIIRAAYENLTTNFTCFLSYQESKNDKENSPNIYNLIFGDLNSLEAFMLALFELIILPIKIFGVWILLQNHMGISANLSVLTYFILYLSSLTLQVIGSFYKKKFMKFRDIRIHKCHEYFSSFTTIRQLFWEELVYNDLISLRKMEVKANLTRFIYLMSGTFLEYNALSIAKYFLFSSFIYQSSTQLSESNKFGETIISSISTLHALNMLTSPTRNIASSIVEGVISFKRMMEFFEGNSCNPLNRQIIKKNQPILIEKKKSNFKVDFKENHQLDLEIFNYNNINSINFENPEMSFLINMSSFNKSKLGLNISNFKLNTNELYILSGKSDSGKTLLINYILDEIYSIKENCIDIFHSSQNLWFPKGTVRSVILFGRKYNKINYEKVIKACSLDLDFKIWKEGDLRQLDESDQTLSNGQKSRISLARTLYYFFTKQKTKDKRNLIILDDIFSTLDLQTSFEIFENLFKDDGGLITNTGCIITLSVDLIVMLASKVKFSKEKPVKVIIMDEGSISYNGLLQNYLEEFTTVRKDFNLVLSNEFNLRIPNNEVELIKDNELESNVNNEEKSELQDIQNYFYSKYIYYFKYIGTLNFILLLLACILKIGITKSMDIYLASFSYIKSANTFITVYSILLVIKLILECFTFISEAILSAKSSSKIHKNYLVSLLEASLSFYSSTPISKILNRFNLDLLVLDDVLVRKIVGVMIRTFEPIIHLLLVFFTNPIITPFSIAHIILLVILYGLPLFYIYRVTQMKILSISSNLNNKFSEIIQGWRVIRDFNNFSLYRQILSLYLMDIIRVKMMQISVINWSSIRIQLLSGPLVIFIYLVNIIYNILSQNKNSASFHSGGINFSYVIYFYITFTETLNLIFIKISSLEKDMCSLERMLEYSNNSMDGNNCLDYLKQEESIFDEQVKNNDSLKFINVELSYQISDYIDDNICSKFKAIKYFNLELNANEHIGIIGRTGCGKSTLIKGILGVVVPSSGSILFNGIEICSLSRRIRREMIGIVPQTPLKVNNWSIRKYLDPFLEHDQDKILNALKITGFYNIIANKLQEANNLDLVKISDSNQEGCLYLTESHLKYLNFVRLILNRKNYKIVLLDEPTIETQMTLGNESQTTCNEYFKIVPIEDLVRDYFQHCCVLIVSHNFNALKNCSRVINLNNYKSKFEGK